MCVGIATDPALVRADRLAAAMTSVLTQLATEALPAQGQAPLGS
jgi:hypothetical protein